MKKSALLFTVLLASLFCLTQALPVSAEESGKTVKAVDVKGNKTVSALTILAKVKTQANTPLSTTVLNEDLKRLYGMGFFTDVRIEQEDIDESSVKVIFHVVEKPILSDIKIEGNSKINKNELKKAMQSVIGDFVDQKRVREDIDALRKLYEKKGFSGATVDSSLDTNDETGQSVLRVTINEGGKVRVVDIRVTGNESIKSGDITKRMKTKKMEWWGWFRSGYLKEEEVAEDIERIKDLYDENGFSDAEVTTSTESVNDKGDLRLVVTVKEGRKYLVGDVRFNGNSVVKNEEISAVLKMVAEKPFSRRGLRMDVANIQDLYFDRGYLSSQIRSESVFNEKTGKVDLNYSIRENELTFVERVRILGNTKTKDIVIRRELRAYPGESFSGAKLKRSKERLYNLGFFEDVRFETEPGSQPNTRDLVVSVKETKTGEFSFGGGYSSIDNVIGFVQVRQKNFDWQNWQTFTGAGQDLAVRLEAGSVRQNAELSFTEPWAWGHNFSFGFDVYRREINRSGSSGYLFDQRKTGGDIRIGKEFSEFDKALLMYKLEEVKIDNIRDDASQALKDEQGVNTTSSLALTLTHDERDNIFVPTKGYYVSGTGEVAGGPLGGDRDFWKLLGTAATYFKHFGENVLEVKGRVGVADEFDDSPTVPIYERYFIGGANTVRGYRERRIGPRDVGNNDPIGGEAFWIVNIEETFPVYPDLIKGAVFYDVGDNYADINDFGDSSGPYQGVGVGVRVKTPIGPVKIDLGYPLDDAPGEKKKVRFYFNISQGF